ncbi:hypothetical protein GGX14DRAFT_678734 [Mycena pura]|uniref:Uncharacterized protein n=1 Tax=Mycena pura TaxID=153505 RepID=A0AAD6Y1E8_9AGAR|nr:hypothetical protein GGX14DRAFT_678734 [Mycena pura]
MHRQRAVPVAPLQDVLPCAVCSPLPYSRAPLPPTVATTAHRLPAARHSPATRQPCLAAATRASPFLLDVLTLATENSDVLPTSTLVWMEQHTEGYDAWDQSQRLETAQNQPKIPTSPRRTAGRIDDASCAACDRTASHIDTPNRPTAPPAALTTPPSTAPPTARPERRAATQPKRHVYLGAVLWR